MNEDTKSSEAGYDAMNPDFIMISGSGKETRDAYAKLKVLPKELFLKKGGVTLKESELEARCIDGVIHIRPRPNTQGANDIIVPIGATQVVVYLDGSVHFSHQGNKYHAYTRP